MAPKPDTPELSNPGAKLPHPNLGSYILYQPAAVVHGFGEFEQPQCFTCHHRTSSTVPKSKP